MILQRAAVTITLGPLALFLIYLGGWFVFVPLVVIMLIAATEFGRMTAALGIETPRSIVLPAVAAHYVVAFLAPQGQEGTWLMGTLLLSLFAILLNALRHYETGKSAATSLLFTSAASVLLIGWLGSHIMLLRNVDPSVGSDYWKWTAVTAVATWGADIGAYLVGSFLTGKILGRHLLTPRLSPKKTYEGYVGGLVIGTLSATITAVFIFGLNAQIAIPLSFILSAIGTFGDLAISMVKRESGIKDSGKLFPGHGGALDRVDSMIWTFAFAFYFLHFFS